MKSNNNPIVPASLFLKTVEELGLCPNIICSDCGTENGLLLQSNVHLQMMLIAINLDLHMLINALRIGGHTVVEAIPIGLSTSLKIWSTLVCLN